jgi:hypothetical protein
MDLPPSLQGRVFDDPAALAGATVIAPLGEGELVQSSAVVIKRGDPGNRELSFTVESGRLSTTLKEGERVDVLATFGTGDAAFTDVVAGSALVVGLEEPRGALGDTGQVVVTVALEDPDAALALAHAISLAKVTVVRATGSDQASDDVPAYQQVPPSPTSSADGTGAGSGT